MSVDEIVLPRGVKMTDEQEAMVLPFAKQLAAMSKSLTELSDAQLDDLEKCCNSATMWNCWAYLHRAAQFLIQEIEEERVARILRKRST